MATTATKQSHPALQIKTPQELVHIKHGITLRQYKLWVLLLRAYREAYESGGQAGEDGFQRIKNDEIERYIGYEVAKGELRTDLESIRKEPIQYNILGKDGKTVQRGTGFISEWEVSSNYIGFKLPDFLKACVERLDLKNAMFQQLNWSVFNSFSGKYEAILYKLCKDYVRIGRTPLMSIDKYREYMGLKAGEYEAFKDLNKFVISGPAKKINESKLSDITITPDYKKEGRRVIGVGFGISTRQSPLGFGDDPAFALARVGISLAQQHEYLSLHSPENIALSIDRANEYADQKEQAGKPVDNLGALYRKAITDNWGIEYKAKLDEDRRKAEKKARDAAKKVVAKPAHPEVPTRKISEQARAKALEAFDQLPSAEQSRNLVAFTAEHPQLANSVRKNPSSPLVRKQLAVWLALKEPEVIPSE